MAKYVRVFDDDELDKPISVHFQIDPVKYPGLGAWYRTLPVRGTSAEIRRVLEAGLMALSEGSDQTKAQVDNTAPAYVRPIAPSAATTANPASPEEGAAAQVVSAARTIEHVANAALSEDAVSRILEFGDMG